ncbi:MAG: hypothetical protein JXB38_17695 [Anaerolineales bacterium]|nr:hypothetical protein [Anaerolineales bacterium]
MTLQDLIRAVDQLDRAEFDQLYAHIESRRRQQWEVDFDAALDALREGLSEGDIREITEAMNMEYIEALDDDE